MKGKWTGHTMRRNCFPKHAIEGKMEGMLEVTGIWGRRCEHYWMSLSKGEDSGN